MSEIKTPPNNTEAERAVLGSILIDTTGRSDDRVLDVCRTNGVGVETFFDPRNREIFSAMLTLNRQSKPMDYISLCEQLRTDGKLEAVGGAAYIQSLVDQTPTAAHAEYYIRIITDKHLRRTMIDRASKTIAKCYDEGEYPDPQVVLGETEKAFLEIGSQNGQMKPWDAVVDDTVRRIDAIFDSNRMMIEGLPTGLKYLDQKILGLKKSEMIVIAARPSVGKTSFAMNIAECCAVGRDLNNVPFKDENARPHPVLIFSLEMPVESLTRRMIAGRAGINLWRVNRGFLVQKERTEASERVYAAASELKGAPIFVDDASALDIMDLRARARRMKKAHNIELIVIDYLQLCRCTEYARQGRQIEVSQISQQIKAMAKELEIPVIVLSQLSRANEQRGDKFEKPKLSDLRDSGAIEQDADVVFLLRRPSRTASDPESSDETLAIIDVAKNRNGETGEVRVNFFRDYVRFGDREIERKENDESYQSSEGTPMQAEFSEDPMA